MTEFPKWSTVQCGEFACCVQHTEEAGCLMVGVEPEGGYQRRYCYSSFTEAFSVLSVWDGKGHPPGHWIKVVGIMDGKPINEYGPGMLPAELRESRG